VHAASSVHERITSSCANWKRSFQVNLAGVSISVVDHVPRELARVTINGLHFGHRVSAREQMHELKVTSVQVDNQLLTTTQPVVLVKAQVSRTGTQTS
jgi:hypothetical protein